MIPRPEYPLCVVQRRSPGVSGSELRKGINLPGVKCRHQPLHPGRLKHHHIKTTRGCGGQAHQVVTCGKNNAPLLHTSYTRRSAPMPRGAAFAHFDKHSGTVRCAHDEVNLTTAPTRRPIIAHQQVQALPLQVFERRFLPRVAQLFGGGFWLCGLSWFLWKETHVSALFTAALAASAQAASAQHYPQGTLYVVATPIGNLADISLRALHVLGLTDVIACEDTRHTQSMLRAFGIEKNAGQLIALHQHNEAQAAQTVIDHLRQGQRIAYVSDAGTPGISDPGARLVEAVQAQGLRAVPLPGPSSVTTLLSVSGIAEGGVHASGFVFAGFLPNKAGERDKAVQVLRTQERAVVLLEAPHRIEALAQALWALGERKVTIGRELTKQFEEIATVNADGLMAWLGADANRLRGEFALVLHPALAAAQTGPDTRILKLLLEQLPLKTAVKLAADITGESRNALYELALAMKAGPAELE